MVWACSLSRLLPQTAEADQSRHLPTDMDAAAAAIGGGSVDAVGTKVQLEPVRQEGVVLARENRLGVGAGDVAQRLVAALVQHSWVEQHVVSGTR